MTPDNPTPHTTPPTLPLRETLESLPPAWPDDPLPEIRRLLHERAATTVVLDDDPTGTQTVANVPVLTTWTTAALQRELAVGTPTIFVLTNSRSLDRQNAEHLARELGAKLRAASLASGRRFRLLSRSDSTLRGHYPCEVAAVAEAAGCDQAPHLVVPFFEEGGRHTLHGVHYVAEDDRLVPAAETPFASDASFGFRHSRLTDWVAEKFAAEGRPTPPLQTLSLEDLRHGGPAVVQQRLEALPDRSVCVSDAISNRDAEVLALAVLRAEANGRPLLVRTAAGLVRPLAGQSLHALLSGRDLIDPTAAAGLVVAGSYVPKTTQQLDALQTDAARRGLPLATVSLEVDRLLAGEAEAQRAAAETQRHIAAGTHVLLRTSRQLVTGRDAFESLSIGRRVSEAVVEAVAGVQAPLRFLIAKGGITSSDIATKALGIGRAVVEGQLLPGVPVWRAGPESRRPNLAYIIFPGNVGSPTALADAFRMLA